MVERTPLNANPLDPEVMKKWREIRRGTLVFEGGKVAYFKEDPEWGDTPVLRKIGVNRRSEAVKRRNEIMKTCAKLIDKIFEDKEIVIKVPSPYGGERKITKRVTVVGDRLATRDAVRAAFSACLRADGNISEDELKREIEKYLGERYEEYVQKLRGEVIKGTTA